MNQYNGILLIPSMSISTNSPGGRADISFYESVFRKLSFFLDYCKENNLRPVFTGRLTTQKLSFTTLNRLMHALKGSDALLFDEHAFASENSIDENNITGVLINSGVLQCPDAKRSMIEYPVIEQMTISKEIGSSLVIIGNYSNENVYAHTSIHNDCGVIDQSNFNTGVATRTLFLQQNFTPCAWAIYDNLSFSPINPPYNKEVFYDATVIANESKRLVTSSNFALQLKDAISQKDNSPSISIAIEKTMNEREASSEARSIINQLVSETIVEKEYSEL